MVELTREDWERIAFAVAQFRHNPQFEDTLEKVRRILLDDYPSSS